MTAAESSTNIEEDPKAAEMDDEIDEAWKEACFPKIPKLKAPEKPLEPEKEGEKKKLPDIPRRKNAPNLFTAGGGLKLRL